jgi:hypothetical protein
MWTFDNPARQDQGGLWRDPGSGLAGRRAGLGRAADQRLLGGIVSGGPGRHQQALRRRVRPGHVEPSEDYVQDGFLTDGRARRTEVRRRAGRGAADHPRRHRPGARGGRGQDRQGLRQGPRRRAGGGRAGRLRPGPDPALPGDQLLPGRAVQGLQVPPLQRRAAGVRAGDGPRRSAAIPTISTSRATRSMSPSCASTPTTSRRRPRPS